MLPLLLSKQVWFLLLLPIEIQLLFVMQNADFFFRHRASVRNAPLRAVLLKAESAFPFTYDVHNWCKPFSLI